MAKVKRQQNDFSWAEKRLSDTPSAGDKSRRRVTLGKFGGE